ncbi:N-methylhydantoinase A/oxoprolinase/acetone carboxylase beta subunit [Brevibacillus nitrificans]|nr:N-methylhydantoinase A/oxoprolinase/acetone carboxylase beta subunit [Brevibacillus nitrificans]
MLSFWMNKTCCTQNKSGDEIQEAIRVLLAESGIQSAQIASAMLGTTHCTDAIVERTRLSKIGVIRMGAQWRGKVKAVAVTSVFSPVDSSGELRAKQLLQEELGSVVAIFLSYEIGNIGLLERENATILNASLTEAAQQMVSGFQQSLSANGIENAHIYF